MVNILTIDNKKNFTFLFLFQLKRYRNILSLIVGIFNKLTTINKNWLNSQRSAYCSNNSGLNEGTQASDIMVPLVSNVFTLEAASPACATVSDTSLGP